MMNAEYGWRANIGLISPASVPNMEHDFHRYVPDGVGVATTRVRLGACNLETLMAMSKQVAVASEVYADKPPDVITFGCTSGSFVGGVGFDKQLIDQIESVAKCKALTTSTSLMDAIRALGVHKLAVVTPYIDEVNEVEKKFLEDQGIVVTSIAGLGLGLPKQVPGIAELAPSRMFDFVKKQDLRPADAVFASCTGLNCTDIIEYVEKDFGIPCLTSNQVTIWGALRAAGVTEAIPGLGTLLREH